MILLHKQYVVCDSISLEISIVCMHFLCMCCVQVEKNRQRKEAEVFHAEREREQQEQNIRNLEQDLR